MTLSQQRQDKTDLVEEAARAMCRDDHRVYNWSPHEHDIWWFKDSRNTKRDHYRDQARVALGSIGIPIDVLQALAEGRMVAMPSPANMTDEMGEAIAIPGRVCGGIAYDIYRNLVGLGSASVGGDP